MASKNFVQYKNSVLRALREIYPRVALDDLNLNDDEMEICWQAHMTPREYICEYVNSPSGQEDVDFDMRYEL